MGHRWSFERNGLPAPFSNGGLLLQQEAAASDFALRAATQPEIAGICAPLAAGYYGEQGAEYAGGVIADGVFAAGEATAEVGVGT